MFAPESARPGLFALHAFNLEIARTREAVSEPALGAIRLQWWRETIAAIYAGSPPRHQVVDALADAVGRHRLTRYHFDRLIDAREADLEDGPPADLAALEDYAAASSAPLTGLALEVLGVADAAADAAGREVAVAWALVGLLRAVPFHARSRRLYLPADRMAAAALDREAALAGKEPFKLAAVAAEVARHAEDHLAAARARRRQVPRAALPALLPAVIADYYLRRLKKHGHRAFDPALEPLSPLGKQFRLLAAALLGRY